MYGNIDGEAKGDPVNTEDDKLGTWSGLLPIDPSSHDHTISWSFEGSYKDNPKEYKWDGSGSIKLVPYYWHWRMNGIIPGGEWRRAEKEFHKDETASEGGSWTVKKNITQIPPNATAPSPPQSISVSRGLGNGQIRLTWTASASDGGSPITDYEYQYCYYIEGYRGEGGYWTSWTRWKPAGKDMDELIRGPRMRTEYRVWMRAVNSVGESLSTNYESIITR